MAIRDSDFVMRCETHVRCDRVSVSDLQRTPITDHCAPNSPAVVRSAVMERLSQATVEDNHASLLDACVEATARYEA